LLTSGHARCLVNVPDNIKFAKIIVNKNLSVRQAEFLVKKEQVFSSLKKIKTNSKDTNIKSLESDLGLLMGIKVDIKNKKNNSGDIKFSYAVGSLKMEHLLDITSAKDSKKYFSDILIIGVNITDWYHTSSITAEAYYKFLKIIKEISLIFPKKKIIYKHHPNFKWNKLEAKILNNSNIKIIIDKKEIKNEIGYILNIVFKRMLNFFFLEPKQDTKLNSLFYGSYRYLLNSQFIISFGSTMILEALRVNRNAFFINPDSLENPYFEKLAHLDKYIIGDLKNLKDKFDNLENSKLIESKEKNYIEGSSSKLICTIIDKITHS
jgi:hypothetical protein